MLRRPASVRKMYTNIGQMDIFIPDVPPALTTAKYSTRWLVAISYAWPPTVTWPDGCAGRRPVIVCRSMLGKLARIVDASDEYARRGRRETDGGT